MFVVLTRGRTGSTPVVADINQHPDVVCHQELFRPAPIRSPHDIAPSYEAVRESGRALSAEDYLKETERVAPAAQVGFKALLQDLGRHAGIGLERFMLDNLRILYLTRDPVTSALSAAIANARGAFNRHVSLSDKDYLDRLAKRVSLDPFEVVEGAKHQQYWDDYWRARLPEENVPHLVISYEEYVSDRLGLMSRIFGFMGVAEIASLPPTPYLKVTSEDVWSDIINADEVKKALGLLG